MDIGLRIKKRSLMLLLVLPMSLLAQQEEIGNWLMYFGTNRVSDTFSVHSEVQYRNHTLTPVNIEQLLLRTGLNYHFSEKAFATGGYAYIANHEFESEQSPPETEEHRIWQQFLLTNMLGRVKFEHRYRLEQRWIRDEFKTRFRYRIMLFVPLNKPKIEEGTLFAGIYDEVFINGKKDLFDRNRLYGALGYQLSKTTSLQVGMLHQQLNDFGKWYLQFALAVNLDFRKDKA